jgi:arginine transport system permease protein
MITSLFDGFLSQVLIGAWVTVKVACCALILGLIFGLLAAIGESSSMRFLRYISTGIISIIRGSPELLVIFFIYFGGTIILTRVLGHYQDISAFVAGVVALALIFGSYASQTFRGAFLAVPRGQVEAAKALGLSRRHIFQRILLPQAWRHALPGLGNLWLVLLKDTALVSLIGLGDMMNQAKIAASTTHKPFTYFLTAALLYLIMTSISQSIVKKLSIRASRHVRPLWT